MTSGEEYLESVRQDNEYAARMDDKNASRKPINKIITENVEERDSSCSYLRQKRFP